MAFLPLALAGLYETLWGERDGWKLLAVGMTGVINSNMPMLEITGILCVIITAASIERMFEHGRLRAI
jgi:hypothetical protein